MSPIIGSNRAKPAGKPAGWMSTTPTAGLQRSQNVELANHRVVVFSGHGSLNTITDSARLQFTVPQGTTITFWVNHTEGLEDAIGTRIDSRWSLQDLPGHVGAALE